MSNCAAWSVSSYLAWLPSDASDVAADVLCGAPGRVAGFGGIADFGDRGTEGREFGDLLVDVGQLLVQDVADVGARCGAGVAHLQDVANLGQRQARGPTAPRGCSRVPPSKQRNPHFFLARAAACRRNVTARRVN